MSERNGQCIRGILFDKDGTLIDFDASFADAYRELAVEVAGGDKDAAERLLVRGGMDPVTGLFAPGSLLASGTAPEIVRMWLPGVEGTAFEGAVRWLDSVFLEVGIRCSVPIAGLHEVLHLLKEVGYALGVATNDGSAATWAALEALGVAQLLPHVFGYDSVSRPKPAPDSVLAFAEATGLTPRDIAVVGDNVRDLVMARNAGAGCAVAVLTGHGDSAELAALADATLPSIRELPGWLRSGIKPISGAMI